MESRRLLSHRLYQIEEGSGDDVSATSGEETPQHSLRASRRPLHTPPFPIAIHILDSISTQVGGTAAVVTPTHQTQSPSEGVMYRPRNNLNGSRPANTLSHTGTADPVAYSQPIPHDTPEGNYPNNLEREHLFNYDDEEGAPPPEEPEQELSWRLDPVISLSDWTIKVYNKETRQPQSYFVHKNVLAVGPRKSEFFVRYFLSHDNMNSNHKSSDIWLERVAADGMPHFLDYIYSSVGHLDITTDSAVGLRHLAQYFGNRVMHQKVMEFISQNLTMNNVLTYYQHSVPLDDDKVSGMCSKKCAENIMSISRTNELLIHIDPSFFRRIMAAPQIDNKEKQYHISVLLAEYCLINRKHLDDQDFLRLSSDQYLPFVHYSAALTLLDMEADLVVNNEENGVVSSLQQRCIKDLTENWQELSAMRQAEVLRVLRKLQSGVVADLLVKSLAVAKTQIAKLGGAAKEVEVASEVQVNRATLELDNLKKAQDEKIAALERKHKAYLQKLKAEYEKNLLKLRDVVLEKDQALESLQMDFAKFKRLPNEPGGRLMQSGPAQQPQTMPVHGDFTADGLVLTKPKKQGKFAIFYYDGNAGAKGKTSETEGQEESKEPIGAEDIEDQADNKNEKKVVKEKTAGGPIA